MSVLLADRCGLTRSNFRDLGQFMAPRDYTIYTNDFHEYLLEKYPTREFRITLSIGMERDSYKVGIRYDPSLVTIPHIYERKEYEFILQELDTYLREKVRYLRNVQKFLKPQTAKFIMRILFSEIELNISLPPNVQFNLFIGNNVSNQELDDLLEGGSYIYMYWAEFGLAPQQSYENMDISDEYLFHTVFGEEFDRFLVKEPFLQLRRFYFNVIAYSRFCRNTLRSTFYSEYFEADMSFVDFYEHIANYTQTQKSSYKTLKSWLDSPMGSMHAFAKRMLRLLRIKDVRKKRSISCFKEILGYKCRVQHLGKLYQRNAFWKLLKSDLNYDRKSMEKLHAFFVTNYDLEGLEIPREQVRKLVPKKSEIPSSNDRKTAVFEYEPQNSKLHAMIQAVKHGRQITIETYQNIYELSMGKRIIELVDSIYEEELSRYGEALRSGKILNTHQTLIRYAKANNYPEKLLCDYMNAFYDFVFRNKSKEIGVGAYIISLLILPNLPQEYLHKFGVIDRKAPVLPDVTHLPRVRRSIDSIMSSDKKQVRCFHQAPYLLGFFAFVTPDNPKGTCQDNTLLRVMELDKLGKLMGIGLSSGESLPSVASHWFTIEDKHHTENLPESNIVLITHDNVTSTTNIGTHRSNRVSRNMSRSDLQYISNSNYQARANVFLALSMAHVYRHTQHPDNIENGVAFLRGSRSRTRDCGTQHSFENTLLEIIECAKWLVPSNTSTTDEFKKTFRFDFSKIKEVFHRQMRDMMRSKLKRRKSATFGGNRG